MRTSERMGLRNIEQVVNLRGSSFSFGTSMNFAFSRTQIRCFPSVDCTEYPQSKAYVGPSGRKVRVVVVGGATASL